MNNLRATLLAIISLFSVATSLVKTQEDPPSVQTAKQIVVRIHRSAKGLEYEMRGYGLKKGDANYWLAEIKLRECNDCQVIPIIDDDVELGAISQVSEMAINAGFKDIRPFVYWGKTGRMAQIELGPAIKFTIDPEKIERRSVESK
jgi:hypothetical protein